MQLSESMRLLDWFAHSVNLIGWPSLVFCAAKALRVGAHKSLCLCRGEIHTFA